MRNKLAIKHGTMKNADLWNGWRGLIVVLFESIQPYFYDNIAICPIMLIADANWLDLAICHFHALTKSKESRFTKIF